MKILVCEHFTAKGHVNLFINICKLLVRSGFEVIAVIPQNFTKPIPFCEVKIMDLKYYIDEYPQKRSILTKTLYCLRAQKRIDKIYKECNIQATIVVTYDEISLAIGRLMGYLKIPTFIIHNLNPDDISTIKYRRLAYNLIKDNVFSIVLAGYIKDFLVSDLGTNPDRVCVLPHPMNIMNNIKAPDIDCVGLSNSNDEGIIEQIIEAENSHGLIKRNNLKVLLKSRNYRYDNGYLKIISGFIDNSQYDDYMTRAKFILIPFPSTFKYRVSGTLIDALSNKKCVFGTDVHVINYASRCYPNVIKKFNITSFIADLLDANKNNMINNSDFNRFHTEHEDEALSAILTNAINNALTNKPMKDTYDF